MINFCFNFQRNPKVTPRESRGKPKVIPDRLERRNQVKNNLIRWKIDIVEVEV
jgi:hypothetical protein